MISDSGQAGADCSKEPKNRGPLALRLAAAVAVGMSVTALSVLAVYGDRRNANSVLWEQMITHERLQGISKGIRAYQRETGRLPESLNELVGYTHSTLQNVADGPVVDGWGRPFIYTVAGSNWAAVSSGRDGQPGGTGTASDLTSVFLKPDYQPVFPSFLEFVFELKSKTRKALLTCVVCGVLASLVSLFTLHVPKLTARGTTKVVLRILATVVGSAFIAFMIGALHIPTH